MIVQPELHRQLLELSDAVGLLSRRLEVNKEGSKEFCAKAEVLLNEYAERLKKYEKEKRRLDSSPLE